MRCFFHTDMDGYCSAAIVYKSFLRDNKDWEKISGEKCEFVPIDYKDDFPFDKIILNETVVLVDYSLQKPGDFEKLKKLTDRIFWIDHHKTAIEKHKGFECAGIRQDGVAACVLTWKYYYPDEEVPEVVNMLGAYDIWDFSKYGEELNKLQAGIRLYDINPGSDLWVDLLTACDYEIETLVKICDEGEIALKYRNNYYAGLIKSWSFWAEFEGYKAICCNMGSTSSQLFDSVKEDYDLMMPFVFDGRQWSVSIYTKKRGIDVSKLAEKFGGGGHRQASGFQCTELPFTKIEKRGE